MSDTHMESTRAETSARRTYAPEAEAFLREGLDYTVRSVHGEPPQSWRQILVWMFEEKVTIDELAERFENGQLPEEILTLLSKIGGVATLESRHVTGRSLCHGLRELALQKWGLMASSVLASWNVYCTRDFGELVFDLVARDQLQKRETDRIEDFDAVFDFSEAFDRGYEVRFKKEKRGRGRS
jgi:uncharacterized repeat protein (TIGR04138 family)